MATGPCRSVRRPFLATIGRQLRAEPGGVSAHAGMVLGMAELRSSDRGALSYLSARFALRAPRVAVVFDGGDEVEWTYRVVRAMRHICQTWGGAGFILVPHRDGEVSPLIARLVREYDPDFVTAARLTLGEAEMLRPGYLAGLLAAGGADAAGVSVTDLLASSADFAPADPVAWRAVDQLRGWCSSYRRRIQTSWLHEDFAVPPRDESHGVAQFAAPEGAVVGVPISWRGPVAAATAAQLGVIADSAAALRDPSSQEATWCVRRILDPYDAAAVPPALLSERSDSGAAIQARYSTALAASQVGLTPVRRFIPDARLHYVIGETADDFAAAMILDRMRGGVSWIHPDWLAVGEYSFADDIGHSAFLSLNRVGPGSGAMSVCSASLSRAELTPFVDRLVDVVDVPYPGPRSPENSWSIAAGIMPVQDSSFGHLSVAGQYDRFIPVPAYESDSGTVEFASALPIPDLPPGHVLADARLPFEVDVELEDRSVPRGRGIDSAVLFADEIDQPMTVVRTTRNGLSYRAMRQDFVVAGATSFGRFAQPRLSVPGLWDWAAATLATQDLSLRRSGAGQLTLLAATAWGGRRDLVTDMGTEVHALLSEAFTPPKGSRRSYLDGEGVRVDGGRGVVTFAGLRRYWGEADGAVAAQRSVLDRLAGQGVLRRGVVLKCSHCSTIDFTSVDDLGQNNVCRRCNGLLPLDQSHWNKPLEEPRWFYDAHPAALDLVRTHGDAPLLLAEYLRRPARHYVDLDEFDILKGSVGLAEVDLLAMVDGSLVVAEVKTTNDLGTGRTRANAIRRRADAAAWLGADEVVYATTREWSPATIEAIRNQLAEHHWPDGLRPPVRFVENLGHPAVTSHP